MYSLLIVASAVMGVVVIGVVDTEYQMEKIGCGPYYTMCSVLKFSGNSPWHARGFEIISGGNFCNAVYRFCLNNIQQKQET